MIASSTDLLPLLPPWYAQVEDYQQICQAERPTFEQIKADLEQVRQNFAPLEMDLSTVEQWEEVLHILADPAAETLDFRRYRIINRVSTKPPFTLEFLRRKLDELIGPGLWSLDVDYPNYTLYIESSAQTQIYSQEVEFTINRIKPAHILYIHRAIVVSDAAVGEEIRCTQYRWNYALSAWNLGALPFADILNEEVVKTENTPSVQPALLEKLLDVTANSITAARINGSILIPDISKSFQSGQLWVTYPISPDQTDEITRVELLNTQGEALTSASVYIPVTDTVSVRHTITLREGGASPNANDQPHHDPSAR